MIEISGLTIKNSERTILDEVKLKIRPGERIGITGASGIGKSTLAFALLGEVGAGLSITGGSIAFEGVSILEGCKFRRFDKIGQLRRMTGHLDQDPASSLNPKHRIGFIITELAADRGEECKKRIRETFEFFGLPTSEEFLRRYPHELSGGQRRRVALARVLLRNPGLLILDEPTADLDSDTRSDVLLLLNRLTTKLKAAVLVISHDFEVTRRLADVFYSLCDGRLLPQSEDAHPVEHPTQCATQRIAEHTTEYPAAQPVLELKKLSARPPAADKAVISELSLKLHRGEAIGITGPSGAGKTSLLRTILGIWRADSGAVFYNGDELSPELGGRTAEQRRALGFVPQDPRISFNPSVPLDKAFSRIKNPIMPLSEVLKLVGMLQYDLTARYPDTFSGGQIQRLAIARALAEGGEVLLLDEVTSSLDPQSRDSVCSLLCALKPRYAILFVTHDETALKRLCDREIRLI